MLRMDEVALGGKRVIIREDFNVPLKDGLITDDTRLRAAVPTIKKALDRNAAVILLSHLGRPTEGQFEHGLSLEPVAEALSNLLGQPMRLARSWLDGVEIEPGACVLCENVRFAVGEKANDDGLARRMAALGDVFVHDAFATAHRAQASTHGIAKFAPVACAGPLLTAEIEALEQALETPARPLVAVVGGAKVSTKLEVLETLVTKVDQLIVGGGIANTFLKAAGYEIGNSLCEDDMVDIAARLIDAGKSSKAAIPIPVDVICGRERSETAPARVTGIDGVAPDEMIMDVGPETSARLTELLQAAGTIVWNGPLGVFELEQFAAGTKALATAIAEAQAFSIAGGGDTLAAIAKFGVGDRISYLSTGGGAFLEFLEGKTLPAVEILESRSRSQGAPG